MNRIIISKKTTSVMIRLTHFVCIVLLVKKVILLDGDQEVSNQGLINLEIPKPVQEEKALNGSEKLENNNISGATVYNYTVNSTLPNTTNQSTIVQTTLTAEDSTQRIFTNFSEDINKTVEANCTFPPSTQFNETLSCRPLSNYTWKIKNYQVVREVDWAPEGNIVRFKTDCWASPKTDQCFWVTICWQNKSENGGLPYECKVYGKQLGPQNKPEIFTNTSTSGQSMQANCSKFSNLTPKGSIDIVHCTPVKGHIFRTPNLDVQTRGVFNSKIGEYSTAFYSDCFGQLEKEECYWITVCDKSSSSFGFDCRVYSYETRSNTSSNPEPKCAPQVFYSPSDPTWCSNCTICNFTNPDSSPARNVTCRSCRTYSFSTQDYSVHKYNKSNSTSQDGVERYFTTDCSSSGCGWCAVAHKTSTSFSVSMCHNETVNAEKTHTFKYQQNFGIEWCANCTVRGSEFSGCSPCEAWAPFTTTTCKENITRISGPGISWCANCTTCSDGFQVCTPCQTDVLSSGMDTSEGNEGMVSEWIKPNRKRHERINALRNRHHLNTLRKQRLNSHRDEADRQTSELFEVTPDGTIIAQTEVVPPQTDPSVSYPAVESGTKEDEFSLDDGDNSLNTLLNFTQYQPLPEADRPPTQEASDSNEVNSLSLEDLLKEFDGFSN